MKKTNIIKIANKETNKHKIYQIQLKMHTEIKSIC